MDMLQQGPVEQKYDTKIVEVSANNNIIRDKRRVLIIERNNAIYQFYKIVFEKTQFYKVTRALNETQGLELAKKDKYNIVLYEKYTTKINETDFVKQLREWEKEQNITIPQVVFCASEDKNILYNDDFVNIISKPLNKTQMNNLLYSINNYV